MTNNSILHKKMLLLTSILTVSLTVLSACGSSSADTAAVAGRTEVKMSDEEFKELNHKFFVENQQETVLERHDSLTITYDNDYPLEEGSASHYYITKDSVYQEAKNWIEYNKDRLTYQVSNFDDPENMFSECIINLMEDYEGNLWRYIPKDESQWFDYEHDHFESAYKEDGKLFILSKYDKGMSKAYCETWIGDKYDGEIYTSESVYDEQNYDLLKVIMRKEKGGKSEIIETITFEYDKPEPAACSVLRVMFEQNAKLMVNVTCTVDPDTDHEMSKTATVPANTMVGYLTDDMDTIQAFLDRACTNPVTERWDRMSDYTFYLKHVGLEGN